MSLWKDMPEFKRLKIRNLLIAETAKAPGKELTHEIIESAVFDVVPDLARRTIEDDEVHSLITEIYAEYARNGAVD